MTAESMLSKRPVLRISVALFFLFYLFLPAFVVFQKMFLWCHIAIKMFLRAQFIAICSVAEAHSDRCKK